MSEPQPPAAVDKTPGHDQARHFVWSLLATGHPFTIPGKWDGPRTELQKSLTPLTHRFTPAALGWQPLTELRCATAGIFIFLDTIIGKPCLSWRKLVVCIDASL